MPVSRLRVDVFPSRMQRGGGGRGEGEPLPPLGSRVGVGDSIVTVGQLLGLGIEEGGGGGGVWGR